MALLPMCPSLATATQDELEGLLAARRSCQVPGKPLFRRFVPSVLGIDFYEKLAVDDVRIGANEGIAQGILAITVFSEARWENAASAALVTVTILKRAGFTLPCAVYAAANTHYSQWLLTALQNHYFELTRPRTPAQIQALYDDVRDMLQTCGID